MDESRCTCGRVDTCSGHGIPLPPCPVHSPLPAVGLKIACPRCAVLEKVLEAAELAGTGLSNLIDCRGHESLLLKDHPAPCSHSDFCVMSDASRRASMLRAAIAAAKGKEGT